MRGADALPLRGTAGPVPGGRAGAEGRKGARGATSPAGPGPRGVLPALEALRRRRPGSPAACRAPQRPLRRACPAPVCRDRAGGVLPLPPLRAAGLQQVACRVAVWAAVTAAGT